MHARLRAVAAADVDAAIDYYRGNAGPDIAVDFINDLEAAISHLTRYPFSGSLRFGYELEIPDLRSWSLTNFPYLIFYLPDEDHLDIWRVLHAKRDIPAHLLPDSSTPEHPPPLAGHLD
jgi:toxin ParE1/3/4